MRDAMRVIHSHQPAFECFQSSFHVPLTTHHTKFRVESEHIYLCIVSRKMFDSALNNFVFARIALSHLWHAMVASPLPLPPPASHGSESESESESGSESDRNRNRNRIGIGDRGQFTRAQRNDADARLAAALDEQRTMRDKLAAADAAVLEFKGKFDAMAAVLPPGLLQ